MPQVLQTASRAASFIRVKADVSALQHALKIGSTAALIVSLAVQTLVLGLAYWLAQPFGDAAAWGIAIGVSFVASLPIFVWLLSVQEEPLHEGDTSAL
jgi:hypothetical protein